MEVRAEGFVRSLPRLRRRIRRAAFVAIDAELTGLHSTFPQNNEPSLFDSPVERYLKARQSVQRFTVTQLGLAIFSKENANKYVVHSYNFFLFPSTLGVRDVEFTLSASSIQFLSHYGFDYNKFLKDGIPYMNEVQEEVLRQHLLAGSWNFHSSAADRDVLKKAIDEVTCWIVAAEEEETMILQDLDESYEEFKRNIHNLFPVLIDTKTVTKSMQKNFSGEDAPCHHPPVLVVHVRGLPGLNERQIYQEFKGLCRFDVRRLSKNQFILLSNKYKQLGNCYSLKLDLSKAFQVVQGAGDTFDSCDANLKWCNLPCSSGSDEMHVKVSEWL
ncbi:poly -specific ribonuclease parn-like domain-containing protein 1 [Willisornis vidua]|uniref:Poly -specific ribonuclease parn-like domain-containing protein 1 n=1 Tax=Willisornis vidua TaxID=1566151 RepID=A0ABQ9D148_9PASS|nr:poly -specific ribonuclease parn-like domain-containing protein 1 [Willisornis vidua]